MTRLSSHTLTALALGALGLSACAADATHSDQRTRTLSDTNKDGLLVEVDPEPDSCIILPEPGDCPVMSWTETHTVTTDASGMIISDTYTVCTQCFEEDGTTPIGDEVCYDEPPVPVDEFCTEYDSGDPTVSCYYCVAADGTVIIDECWPLPVECVTDTDCPDGQVCYVWDDGMGGGTNGGGMGDPGSPLPPDGMPTDPTFVSGYCGYPDPCVFVDTLPGDPTGTSCWQCTDPATGADLGSWCDLHTCNADGTCTNPWEVCDPAGSGTCVYDDPCDPVADGSAWGDTTGSDCYQCIDPATGEDWGGWCNAHTCESNDDCAPFGQSCSADGVCEWVDPCVPVDHLDSDPTGVNCYSCVDPAGMGDWSYCSCHSCSTDGDCTASGYGTACVDGICNGE